MSLLFSAALKVLILAGAGAPEQTGDAYRDHVSELTVTLLAHGVAAEDIAIFWGDGRETAPDRFEQNRNESDWPFLGTQLDALTAESPKLVDTRFDGFTMFPARRNAIQSHLKSLATTLSDGDQILFAVSGVGEVEGDKRSLALYGERWTAEAISADFSLIPESVPVVMWMSACHSGAFSDLFRQGKKLCGAFSDEPERELSCEAPNAETDHFSRITSALNAIPTLGAASDLSLLTVTQADVPHLSSDALLHEALLETAAARSQEIEALIDARLLRSAPDAPEWRLAAQIAQTFGLGVVRDFSSTREVMDRLIELDYALEMWRSRWVTGFDQAKNELQEPLLASIKELPTAQAKKRARNKVRDSIASIFKEDPVVEARMNRLYRQTQLANELKADIELKQAAVLRIAYLYMRLAGPTLLDPAVLARYEALRECESLPLWDYDAPIVAPTTTDPDFVGPAMFDESLDAKSEVASGSIQIEALPTTVTQSSEQKGLFVQSSDTPVRTLGQIEVAIESLHPSSFSLTYRDLPDYRGVSVLSVAPGGAALAAGLQVGDKILSIDGRELTERGAFPEAALLAKPGERVLLGVWREGQKIEMPLIAAPLTLPKRPPEIGDKVPTLRLKLFDSNTNFPSIGAQEPVLVFFFATWCSACFEAVPAIEKWAAAKGAKVIAVTREDRESVEAALKARKKNFPFVVALDPEREATRLLNPRQMPSFFHIDAFGRLAERGEGFRGGRLPLEQPKKSRESKDNSKTDGAKPSSAKGVAN